MDAEQVSFASLGASWSQAAQSFSGAKVLWSAPAHLLLTHGHDRIEGSNTWIFRLIPIAPPGFIRILGIFAAIAAIT